MMRLTAKRVLPGILLTLCMAPAVSLARSNNPGDGIASGYDITRLPIFNRSVLILKEQYVDPSRMKPAEMLRGALSAMEREIPSFLVSELGNDLIEVSIAGKRSKFDLSGVDSVWKMSFALRDVLRFAVPNLGSEVDLQELEYAAVNGMLSRLDPHSMLLEPKDSSEMKLSTVGKFGGLGVVISIRDGGLTIISPIDGTPASRAGLMANDKVVRIGDESTVNMPIDEAVDLLRGPVGTKITIWIERKGLREAKKVVMKRAEIKVDSVQSKLLAGNIAYIKVKQFQRNTTADVADALAKMSKKAKKSKGKGKSSLQGVLLDLRNNPGGLLDQSVTLADLFLGEGPVVITQEGGRRADRHELDAGDDASDIDLPLAVLVNGGSASASEIVSGAIKNRQRGIVIGAQTFGKGSVQQLIDYPDRSALKLTIGQYLTPGNESIQSVGITPDIQLQPMLLGDNPNLIPDTVAREAMLESALSDSRTKKRSAALNLSFLKEAPSEKERYSNDIRLDVEMEIASAILLAAPEKARAKELLEVAGPVLKKWAEKEERKLVKALAKEKLDWGAYQNEGEPARLSIESIKPKYSVLAGEELELGIKVTNLGTNKLSRVYGVSRGTSANFFDLEFLIGALEPGESKVAKAKVKMPSGTLTKLDEVEVKVYSNEREMGQVLFDVETQALAKPRLIYSMAIDDRKYGNGDGRVDMGEKVKLRVALHNRGEGKALKPVVFLKNESGDKVFLKRGRANLEPIEPGASGVGELEFTRKSEKDIRFALEYYDAELGSVSRDEIVFPLNKSFGPKSTKELQNEVPALHSVKFDLNTHAIEGESLELPLSIEKSHDVKDVYVYVNREKVFYENVNSEQWKKTLSLKLRPGGNTISVFTTLNQSHTHVDRVNVFSRAGDAFRELLKISR